VERVLPRHADGPVRLVGRPGADNGGLVRDDLGRGNFELGPALFKRSHREIGSDGELGLALRHRDEMLLHSLETFDRLAELMALVRVATVRSRIASAAPAIMTTRLSAPRRRSVSISTPTGAGEWGALFSGTSKPTVSLALRPGSTQARCPRPKV